MKLRFGPPCIKQLYTPLNNHVLSFLKFKVNLALQLIQLADRLTNNAEDFALYMLDITYDSFAVKRDGHVILTELQNILVVDRQAVRSGKTFLPFV